MARVDLRVPFTEKDEAKRLGARWDARRKCWYVPDGANSQDFLRWVPPSPDFVIRSSHYFVAETTVICRKRRCRQPTRVYALLLPSDFELWEVRTWDLCEFASFIEYVTDLSSSVVHTLERITPTYHRDGSKTADGTYWMNHCEHCGAKLGDFYLHDEPGDGFFVTTPESAADIKLYPVPKMFQGNAPGISQDSGGGADLIDFMTIIQS